MAVPAEQGDTAAFLATLGTPSETHISLVLRGADTVYKLKKAVRLDFLDFTDVGTRRRLLHREIELNAPYAPGLYRDVVPVTREPHGLALDGPGPVIDHVLRMARIPDDGLLNEALHRLDDPARLTALADQVAAMHATQPPVPVIGPVERLRTVLQGNVAAARTAALPEPDIAALHAALLASIARAAPAIEARAPLTRRCHGDLHLGNIVLWQGRPTPFDALEFDEDLATIDPAYDLAFLLMDLDHRLSRAAANRVLCRYVARTLDAGAVAPLAPYLALRALIRAHAEAASGRDGLALLVAAAKYLRPPSTPLLVAVGGLMGTGKSTLARSIAPALGPAPGALVLRSDEIRKHLAGLPPEAPLPPAAYTDAAAAAVQATLLRLAETALCAGHAVILDATFLAPGQRAAAAALATRAGARFVPLWLEAPRPELERRLAARTGDASDATAAILAQNAATPPPEDWPRLDATDAEALRQDVQRRISLL